MCTHTLVMCWCGCDKPWTTASRTAGPTSAAAHPPSGAVPRSRTCAAQQQPSPRSLTRLPVLLLQWPLCLQQRQPWQPSRSTRCPPRSFRLWHLPFLFFSLLWKEAGWKAITPLSSPPMVFVCVRCLFSSGHSVSVWKEQMVLVVVDRMPCSQSSALCGRA